MGNEASAEGGDGDLPAVPAAAAADPDGGASAAMEAGRGPPGTVRDATAHREAYVDAKQPLQEPGSPPTQGSSGISKSQTVDAFRTGPAARQTGPGRSPSSVSLLESRSRLRGKEEPRKSMFSSNFLSGANPLSAVSSAVNKFSLFGDEAAAEEAASSSLSSSSEEEDEGAKKQKPLKQLGGKASAPGKAPQRQQQQGPPRQGQGSPQQRGPPQQASTKPGPQKQGPLGPQSQGVPKSGGQPQHGPTKGGPQQQAPGKPGPETGPAKAGPPPPGPGNEVPPRSQGPTIRAQKSLCPLCKTTELNLHTKEQPNYSTCTQCKSVVCSLCGFSPPDSTVKEWLCLNCQMQRALGGMDPPGPPVMKPQPQPQSSKQAPKQGPTPGPLQTKQAPGQASAPSSPQTKKAPGQDSAPSSPQTKKVPGQDSTPSSPQTKQAPLAELSSNPGTGKPIEGRKPSPLTKQESVTDAGLPVAPPAVQKAPASPTPHQPKSEELQVEKPVQTPAEGKLAITEPRVPPLASTKDPSAQQQQPPIKQLPGQSTSQEAPSGSPKLDPKTKRPLQDLGRPTQQMPKGGTGPPSAKSSLPPQVQPPKQESSFFGLSFGGLPEVAKPQSTDPQSAAESVTGKLFGFSGFTEPPKPQPTGPQPAAESVTGKLFGFAGLTEAAKPQPSAPQQATESVTGKLFGFGGLTEAAKPQASAPQPPDSVTGKMFGFSSSIFSSASNLITSAVQEEHPAQPSPKVPVAPQQGKAAPSQEKRAVPEKAEKHPTEPPRGTETTAPSPKVSQPNCPLCKVELNVGSKDPPNYNTCTECKNTVCNLCGFNPMPHLRENEWLCLTCQTQRALAGQLGDMGRMPPPAPAPSKPVGQQTTVSTSHTTPVKETTQAADSVPMEPVPTKPQEKMEVVTVKAPTTDASKFVDTREPVAAPDGSVSYPEAAIDLEVASSETLSAPLEEVAAPELTSLSADMNAIPEATIQSEVAVTKDNTTPVELTSPLMEESDASVQSSESEAACLKPKSIPESAFGLPKSTPPYEAVDASPEPSALEISKFVTHPDSKVAHPIESTDDLNNDNKSSEAVTNHFDSTEASVSLQEPSCFSETVRDNVTSSEPATPSDGKTFSPEGTNTTEAVYVAPEPETSPHGVIIPSLKYETTSDETLSPETMTAEPEAIPSEPVVVPDNATLPSSAAAKGAVFVCSEPETITPSSEDITPDDNSFPKTVSSPTQAEAGALDYTYPKPTHPSEPVTAPTEAKTVHCDSVVTRVDGVDPPECTETVLPEVFTAVHHDVALPEPIPPAKVETAHAEFLPHEPTATSEVEVTLICERVTSSEESEAVSPEPTVIPEGTTPETTILTEVISTHQEPEVVPLEAVVPVPRSTFSSEAVSASLKSEAPPKPASPPEIVAVHSELTLSPEAFVAPVELEAVPPKPAGSPEFVTIDPDSATPPSGKTVGSVSEHAAAPPQSVSFASPPAMGLSRMKTVEETEEHIAASSPEKTSLPRPVTAPLQLISANSPPTKGLSRMKTVEAMEEDIIHVVKEEKETSVEAIISDENIASDSAGSSQKYLQDITDSSCISVSLGEDLTFKEELLDELTANATSPLVTRSSPLDLAKLESRQEVKATSDICNFNDLEKDIHRPKTLSVSPKSHDASDGVPGEIQIKDESPCLNAPGTQPYHFEEDSEVKTLSLPVQERDKVAKDHPPDNLNSGDDEEFIRKEIMDMRRDENVAECTQDQKPRQDESKKKSTSGQSKLLFEKSTITKEEGNTDAGIKEEIFCRRGIQDFKIDIENTTTTPYKTLGSTQASADGELEMESLANSPEDRSRGEGSSSLHASSFTPGTSPTSVSSMDEDSDSSPSHKRLGEEGKQRKARHRQHVLPTIEDSSEEEELREEEELLREQDKQQEADEQHMEKRSSSRKSKRGKDELRAQWRRENPITPTRNLSPIEDASPTEELRQAVEMEELHKSSANSPCAESAPEGFETNAEQFATFQKMYEPPSSVSLYSQSDEKNPALIEDMHNQTVDLYRKSNKTSVQEPVKKLRSADEAYEDIMQKRTEFLKHKEIHQSELANETFQQQNVLRAVNETCYVTISSGDTVNLGRDKNTVTDAAANAEQMKQERTSAIPGMNFNQATQVLHDSPEVIVFPSQDGMEGSTATAVTVSSKKSEPELVVSSDVPLIRTLHPIPDLKITQCSSGEEDLEDEAISSPDIPQIEQSIFKIQEESVTSDTPTATPAISTVEVEPVSVICETPQPKIIRTELPDSDMATVQASTEIEPISVVCEVPQPMTIVSLLEAQGLQATSVSAVPLAPPSDTTQVLTPDEMQPASPTCKISGTEVSPPPVSKLASVLPPATTKQIPIISEVSQPTTHISPPAEAPLHKPGSASDLSEITVVCEIPQAKYTLAFASVTALAPEQDSTPEPGSALAPLLTPAVKSVSAVDRGETQAPFVCPIKKEQPPPSVAQLPLTAQVESVIVDMQHSADNSNTIRGSVVESTSVPPHPKVVSHIVATPANYVISPVTLSGPEQIIISARNSDNILLVDHSTKEVDVRSVEMTTPSLTVVAASQDYSAVSAVASSLSSPIPAAVVSASPLTTIPQHTEHPSTVSAVNSGAVHSALTSVPMSAPYHTALPSCSSHEFGMFFKTPSPSLPPTQLPPPPTQPEPSVCPKGKAPASTTSVIPSAATVPVSTVVTMAYATITTTGPSAMGPTYMPQVSPSVSFSPQTSEMVPCVFPKPVATHPEIASQNIKTIQPEAIAPHSVDVMTLNLSTPAECKITASSPKSPLSPRFGNSLHETYVVITLPSEPGSPCESIITQAPISQVTAAPSKAVDATVPVAVTQYTKSVENQEIWGPDTIVSGTSHRFSSVSTSGQSSTLPTLFTKVLTTEVQRTTVSVVCERILPSPVSKTSSIAISIPSEAKVKLKPKENGKVHYSGDVVDLRTLKLSVAMTEKGMDLTSPDSRRQSFSSDSSGRQTSAVQPSVVNLSAETPASTLSFVTDTITIVTCTATIAYKSSGDRPMTKGPPMPTPLQLTTTKTFEPVAQIIYRPVNSKPVNSSTTDVPINLSFGAMPGIETPKSSVSESSPSPTNSINGFPIRTETGVVGAVDLTTTKPAQMVASVKESTSNVITSVLEEDGKPVDLTGGRRVVCCDVVYKLPFASICTAPQPATTLPEDRFGYRDDHYQYSRARLNGTKGFSGLKPSMSDTNLAEAGLFLYKSKNSYDYHNGATEGAVDLTSGKMSKGELTCYSSEDAGRYSGMTIPQYSQTIPTVGPHFGVNSILKYSDGVVYSSIAAPLPSTFAITTQPVSIFSSTCKDFSGMDSSSMMQSIQTVQDQMHPQSYNFLSTSPTKGGLQSDAVTPNKTLSSPFPSAIPTATEIQSLYIDGSLETIAAPMQVLPTSVLLGPESSKDQQYEMERELLELEKVKQLRMAEEIEWERQEIKRFREQEQLIVQQELEKLQTMKHQLLFQQEEERQAHLIMQQETYAQHQLQLEQIHQLQQQLQVHLEEQKMRQIYGYDPSDAIPPLSSSEQILQDQQFLDCNNGQLWPVQDKSVMPSVFAGFDLSQQKAWLPVPTHGVSPHTPSVPGYEQPIKESNGQNLQLSNQVQTVTGQHNGHKKIDSGVQTDGEDIVDRAYSGRRRRSRKSVDSSVQTDDEDQDVWDVPARSRRRSRSSRYTDGEKGKQASKLSSIAIQTVAEISVQTDPSGSLKRPSVRAHVDTKVELSSPEKPHRGSSLSSERRSPQRDKKRPTPLEITYTTHLKADSPSLQVAPSPPKSPKVLYSPVSPLFPRKLLEYASYEKSISDPNPQKIPALDPSKVPPESPQVVKSMQHSTLESKTSSSTAEEQEGSKLEYSDAHLGKASQTSIPSAAQKKVKRTLPNPPQDEEAASSQTSYSTGSARRRLCRNITVARAKILQDIDRELDLVERESSKLRQKQAELDEEEKEIDARLRYLEMGINRRRDALLKEREKRERDYLQGVAEERDYMSDSEVSNLREKRRDSHGLERPKTAPQSELNKFIPPQTEPTSPYAQYQYASPTQAPQQTRYQQSSFYECQQTSPYQSIYSSVPTPSFPQSSHQRSQPRGYQHASQTQLMHQKPRQTVLTDLEPKITTNYEVIRNQPVMIGPSSADTTYGLPHLGSKYNNLSLRMGLDERSSVASSPMSSISADSFYADIDHHTPKNYLLFNDLGDITKGSTGLSSNFSIPDKDIAKADRLLRAAEMRDYLGPMQASSRLHPCMKVQEDAMEEPYELKLLKQQIKQEFRRSADGLDPLTGLHHYYPSDSSYRHFHKAEKYSIGRLTLEKQAAKQLPASVLYQKQAKYRRSFIDPKITKFSPIQECRDIGLDYSSYVTPSTSHVSGLASRTRLLQDDISYGLRKSITEQQKYLGSTLAQSLNLGHSLNQSPHLRPSLQDDTVYPSGSRSRPSSRPSSVYGLDLSIKRDLSSSSLRLKMENDGTSLVRTKPSNLPISQSRGRIPIVAQNSEEESPLSPVGQPMGMARASAGPLPPISADLRDQFGSSHSLPEVQQHMREESRTRAYDRDTAFLMDDMQGLMLDTEAHHLRQEEMDWFNKHREVHSTSGFLLDHRQVSHKQIRQHGEMKPSLYPFPHTRVKIQRDPKDHSVSGNGLGMRVVGGKEIPGNTREIGAYVASVTPGSAAEQTRKIVEGMQILEWNGVSLTGKTYEEVQGIVSQPCGETEICVRLDLNMLSDHDHPQCLELQHQSKPGAAGDRQRSPGVDPNQLSNELQNVSQQQAPSALPSGVPEKGAHVQPGATSVTSSAVHSPGRPGSPSVNKKRQSSKPAEAAKTQTHPITGDIQLQLNYDRNVGNLIVHVLQARNLAPRDNNGYSDPFVKVYLLPGRSQVMVVQNASAENKRRSKSSQRSLNPEWNQTVIYKNIHLEQLKKKTLEVTVWDYDRFSSNDFLGEVLIDLSNTAQLDNMPRWLPLKEQSETLDHGRPRSGQGIPQPPKPSVIKSRSHGVFPDPSKDMQLPTIEKSHSSPGSSKSSSESHLRSHGPSRSQSKSSVTQAHLEDAGVAIAAAEAAVQQLRYQPTRPGHRPTEAPVKTVPAVTNLILEEEGGADAVDSAIFQIPQIGKTIPNGTDKIRGLDPADNEGKTQMMGEIKIALKKETKTEGEQLIVEILQCRNITYKFKSPDHLPDLYVKLYVVNVATQKKLIKKKTRVCRHDREPSFNETFRFTLNPTGHSLQLFLVSNGGKFVKKTLVGEAYVWLDKVDLRKRTTSWHKLLASSPQSHP